MTGSSEGPADKPALKTLELPGDVEVMEDGKPFFFEGKDDVGCLLIHGFTGTTQSLRPMGEYLAAKGLTVLGPRLPGHGTNVKDMGRWSYRDWTKTVETALEEICSLCDKVFVAGLSMGGTLTLYLAENHQEKISGVMPICAPVSRLSPKSVEIQLMKLLPVLKHVLPVFPGPGNDLKDPDASEVAYDKLSTKALHEMVKLAAAVNEGIGRIDMPIRIFVAREDHVVPPENSVYVFENVSSTDKELIWLDNSYHVATLDYDKEKIFETSHAFIQELSGSGEGE